MAFKGSRLRMMSRIILALQAKRDLAGGLEANLVPVTLTPREHKEMLGIPIVEEFLEVFADDLSRLSLIESRVLD